MELYSTAQVAKLLNARGVECNVNQIRDFAWGIANPQVWCKGEMLKADASKLLPIVCGVRDQCPLYRPRPTGERLLVVAYGSADLGCNPYREWRSG